MANSEKTALTTETTAIATDTTVINPTRLVEEVFPDFHTPKPSKPPQPCSYNLCSNGHPYRVKLAIAECPGCKAQILAVQMENCPVCNEPVKSFQLRSDHIMSGGGIAAVCGGQKNAAEVNAIVMERSHSVEIEEKDWDAEREHAFRTKEPDAN